MSQRARSVPFRQPEVPSGLSFTLENLVCEVSRMPRSSRYSWYELDLDAGSLPVGPLPRGVRLIGATRTDGAEAVRKASSLRVSGITHVQFEASEDATRHIRSLSQAGLKAIPARHLRCVPACPTELARHSEWLSELDCPIVKLVYPAPEPSNVQWGLDVLGGWGGRSSLSLTPHGSRQGRVAAALAGSRLVFAPLRETAERLSASWYRALAVDEHLREESLL